MTSLPGMVIQIIRNGFNVHPTAPGKAGVTNKGIQLTSPVALMMLVTIVFTHLQDSSPRANGPDCGKPVPNGPSTTPAFIRVMSQCAADPSGDVTIADVLRWVVPVVPSHINVCPRWTDDQGVVYPTVPPQHAASHKHPMELFTEELVASLEGNPQANEMLRPVFNIVVTPAVRTLYVTIPFLVSHFLYRPAFPLLEPTVFAGVMGLLVAREVCRRTQPARASRSPPVAFVEALTTFGWAWIVSTVLLATIAAVFTSFAAAIYGGVSPYVIGRLAGVDANTVRYETGLFRRQLLLC